MEWLLLAAGLLLILGTGFFVAVEFSLVALDQATVQRAVDDGDTAAAPLLKCLKSLSTQLSSCQLGITITTLLTGYVMEPSVGALLEGPLGALGLPEAAVSSVSLILAMAFATLLSMLIGELVPKNMAIALSFQVGKALARPQLIFTAIFKPAIVLLNGFSNKVLNIFGLEAKEEISGARTPAELASLVRRSARWDPRRGHRQLHRSDAEVLGTDRRRRDDAPHPGRNHRRPTSRSPTLSTPHAVPDIRGSPSSGNPLTISAGWSTSRRRSRCPRTGGPSWKPERS